jgi:hypothetical protein
MVLSDEHFQVGVEHGLNDAPLYHWQDPWHQECYDDGYTVGQFQRRTREYHQRYGRRLRDQELLDVFDAILKRCGKPGLNRS